jgi:hypothetical protein
MNFPSFFTHLVTDSLWLSEKIALWAVVCVLSRKQVVLFSVAAYTAWLNFVLPGSPDETIRQIFLDYVDALTPWHLQLLT